MEPPRETDIGGPGGEGRPPGPEPRAVRRRRRTLLLVSAVFVAGWGTGYVTGVVRPDPAPPAAVLAERFDAYRLPVRYGDLGPKLLEAGVIDVGRLVAQLSGQGMPPTEAQLALLREGGKGDGIRIDRQNALFLLDFFWALGLANRNPILTEGPMMRYGEDQVVRFASTGGWRLGAKPVVELYGSAPLVPLTDAQLQRLERVAREVYRPCCDNPTYFPDCNHGMAMLGMLTMMAAADADEAAMFEAAAAANAAWYPQPYGELAVWFDAVDGTPIDDVEPRRLVSSEIASGSGYRKVRQALAGAGLLAPATRGGGVSAC